jgi:membrane associated rhomboid family serine protease
VAVTTQQTCYRHPDRETGVSCSNCGRPICTECMTSTPVGMRCPVCTSQKTQVRTLASLRPDPDLTKLLIGISVVAFLAQSLGGGGLGRGAGGEVYRQGVLFGPLVAEGEWWRLITGGFLHGGLLHLGLNMYALWFLGQLLEPALGRAKFALIYVVSLLGGSFGVMLLSPGAPTVGASGAIFGLLGAALIIGRSRGVDVMASGLGPILLINLAITFLIPNISIGGHLGGLAAGAVVALVLTTLGERRRMLPAAYAAGVVIGVALVVAAIALASSPIASIQ